MKSSDEFKEISLQITGNSGTYKEKMYLFTNTEVIFLGPRYRKGF